MPTTPISVSLGIQGQTNTTLYTVPAGRTAICRAIMAQASSNSSQSFTISKFTNGQNYPLNMVQSSYNTPSTGATQITGANLITAPITLGAGDQMRAYSSSASVYNFPSVASVGSQFGADGNTAYINYIKYGNGIYMAVGYTASGGFVSTSTDCVTWTQKASAVGLTSNFSHIEYTNGIWVGIKENSSGSIFYSTDNGTTWTYATSVSSYSPTCVYSGNNTFVISVGTNVIYSTNGSTWTAASGLSTFLAATGYGVNNVGWTGSHWIVSNAYGSLATTDFTNWSGFGGNGFMENNTAVGWTSLTYSSAYGKYYAAKNIINVPNIGSSTTGILWDRTTITGMTVGKVAVAGSNPVLIACPQTALSIRYKSTDGSTWTSGTDSLGYTGRVWGLENGYFLTFQNNTGGTCYLSTDPITGAGSTTGGGSAADFISRSAAADPITGKWCALGKDNGSNRWIMLGGTSGTNIGSAYLPSIGVDSTNGNPMAVAWSAADNAFYAVSDTGQVRRATSYNSTWSIATNTGTIVGSYNGGLAYAIKVIGTTIYVFISSNTTYAYSMWIGSTLTGGSSFVEYNFSSNGYASAYWRPTWLAQSTQYPFDVETATNGTNYFFMTGTGAVTGIVPSTNATKIVTPPTTTGTIQQAGAYTFTYGSEYVNNSTTMAGWYWSTNIVTTLGTFTRADNNISIANKPPNRILYLGGIYYFNGFGYGGMFSGTTPISGSGALGSGSGLAGTKIVSPNSGFTSDGTSMVGATTQLDFTMNTTTPAAFLYAATVTASVIEIS
jgi:hypothetical protein